jgi:hypothetical protein
VKLDSAIGFNISLDNTIRMLRELATFTDVHITVICHPRKTSNVSKKDGYAFLTEYDLSGRARSVQEADNVIILQTSQDVESGVRKDWIQVVYTVFIIMKVLFLDS